MSEEKNHEHTEHHSHKEDNKKYKFEISKVRIWQGISLILAIAVVFLWSNPGSEEGAQPVQVPTAQPSPTQPTQQQPTKQNIDLDDDPMLGNKDAPVTIVEFSDFQCPYCARFRTQTLSLIQEEYIDTGKVKFVYRDFPLSFHPNAQPAAEASECANEQGKYWEYHDALFENQQGLSFELYLTLAEDLGLDVNKFKTCVETGKYKQEVEDDFNYGKSVGITGTPGSFVNGIKVTGACSFDTFKKAIDAELDNKDWVVDRCQFSLI